MLPEAMFPDHNSYMAYLRDWFAGQALAGTELDAALAGSITDQQIAEDCALLARVMYQIADAMLAERSK